MAWDGRRLLCVENSGRRECYVQELYRIREGLTPWRGPREVGRIGLEQQLKARAVRQDLLQNHGPH
jgi:hypothetical protein